MNESLFASLIAKQLSTSKTQILAVVSLLESGATIPFIARYRKEMTGNLDEVEIAEIQQQLKKCKTLVSRKETILKSISEQGKLNSKLKQQIEDCWDDVKLEDIYLPYKIKRKTRAEIARQKGLEPLANLLVSQRIRFPETEAKKYLSKNVGTITDAFNGAKDIIAEWVSENPKSRDIVRNVFSKSAIIKSKLVKKHEIAAAKYRDYFDFSSSLKSCPSHRLLAIRRAEKEGFLRVSTLVDDEQIQSRLHRLFIHADNESSDIVQDAIADSVKRLIFPSIENEFKKSSKEQADKEAIQVFSENLKQLLLAPPAGSKNTMGIDPGFRSGCKVVVLNKSGDLLENTNIYPHPPQQQLEAANKIIDQLVTKYNVDLVAVGNGTAGRETVSFVKALLKHKPQIQVFSVNESGASIYSASTLAREEFPSLDLTVRGAISIARRLMDPLAELVKIDAKSIGVGQYQHDVNQEMLNDSLTNVVSFAVNKVGINLNTASYHLLSFVSGIGPKLAKNIVAFRSENTAFSKRTELKKVKGLGAKAYEQAAGFLRIPESKNILDNTAVHPESYDIVKKMAASLNKPIDQIVRNKEVLDRLLLPNFVSDKVGLPTLKDIVKELNKPGLDPRGEAKIFNFSEHIREIKDLTAGMVLPGIISNLTKFGAFVDIGIKENGLIHISQITNRFIKDPAEVLRLDQKVNVEVLSIDLERKRIQLNMKGIPQ